MASNNDIFSDLSTRMVNIGAHVLINEPLSAHCTFRIGGPAALMVFPADMEHFTGILDILRTSDVRYTVIGNGSDLLFDDAGYDGVVVSTTKLRQTVAEDDVLYAECGASCSAMALKAAKSGLSGLEFAYGIPGTCGGAVFMNAGAYGSEISALSPVVDCFDMSLGEHVVLSGSDLDMSYRHSIFTCRPELIILGARLRLAYGDSDKIRKTMEDNMACRRAKQPLEYPSAGSVFKRRDGYYMGRVIQDCGLKGCRIGGAQVSEKHAGFIVNRGGATCEEVLKLISHIQNVVVEEYGFMPECEIRYIR